MHPNHNCEDCGTYHMPWSLHEADRLRREREEEEERQLEAREAERQERDRDGIDALRMKLGAALNASTLEVSSKRDALSRAMSDLHRATPTLWDYDPVTGERFPF